MMILKNLFLITVAQLVFGCQLPPVCKDFKTGSYSVETDGMPTGYQITRTEQNQMEKSENNEEAYYILEWLSECSYVSKFDSSKMDLTDEMKMINSDGGIVVELIEVIGGDCITFQSYVKDYKDLSLRKGKFCKIE